MNLCRCERGHFYDKEKYATCPHCAGGIGADNNPTEAWSGGQTVPLDSGMPTPPTPPVQPVPVAESLPIPGMSADQATVGSLVVDNPTVPLEQIIDSIPENEDDHTVGIYDGIFSEAGGTPEKSHIESAASDTQLKPKISSPCVGWLVALGGKHIGTDFRLKAGRNFVGRSAQMDVSLSEEKSVSRERHVIVVYDPKSNVYLAQPGESSSLAYHNTKLLLTPEVLKAYDTITVGDVNLLFIPLCSESFNWGDLLEELKNKKN